MSDWETSGDTATSRPAITVAVLVGLAAGLLIGAVLLGDLGERPCYEVHLRAQPLWDQLHAADSDQMEAVRQLARLADRHTGCFEPARRQALRDVAEHGPPRIGVLQRPAAEEDRQHGVEGDSQLVLSEARLAQRTDAGSFYVVPGTTSSGQRRQVCLLLTQPDGTTSTSCGDPVAATIQSRLAYPVVLTLGFGGIAGIVGDGVGEVRVDGAPVPVDDNVFVAGTAPPDARIELPD